MAKQNTSNPNVTTGGSYENPRLGIVDYGAFQKGMASTFVETKKAPKVEVDDLEGLTAFKGTKGDDFTNGLDIGSNNLINQDFEKNTLGTMNSSYQKAVQSGDKKTQDLILSDLNVHKTSAGNFQASMQMLDPDMYDHNVSPGKSFIGVNGEPINVTWEDFAKTNKENPGNIKQVIKINKNGEKKGGYNIVIDGKTNFINSTDMNETWRNNNFNMKANLQDNINSSMDSKDGITNQFDVKPTYNQAGSSYEVLNSDGSMTTIVDTEGKKITDDWYNNANNSAVTAAENIYKSANQDSYESAFHQFKGKIQNGDFRPSEDLVSEILQQSSLNSEGQGGKDYDLSNKMFKDLTKEDFNNLPDELKIRLLQDEAAESWKVNIGQQGYSVDENGRAQKTRDITKESKDTKLVDDGSGKFNVGLGNWQQGSYANIFDTVTNSMDLDFGAGTKGNFMPMSKTIYQGLSPDAKSKLFNDMTGKKSYTQRELYAQLAKANPDESKVEIQARMDVLKSEATVDTDMWQFNSKGDLEPVLNFDGSMQGFADWKMSTLSESQMLKFDAQFEAFKNDPKNLKYFPTGTLDTPQTDRADGSSKVTGAPGQYPEGFKIGDEFNSNGRG